MGNYRLSLFEDMMAQISSTISNKALIPEHGIQKAALLNYLEKNGIPLDSLILSKRIQSGVLYDSKFTQDVKSVSFFQGDFDSNNTNMRSSYTLPQEEHKIIYGCYIEEALDPVSLNEAFYDTGILDASSKNAVLSVVSNGVTIAKDIPLSFQGFPGDIRTPGVIPFREPFLWKGQTNLEVIINFKSSNAIAPATRATRVNLMYYGIIS